MERLIPKVGDYILVHHICGSLWKKGYATRVEPMIIKGDYTVMIDNVHYIYSFDQNFNDYFVPKELMNTEIGQLIWN